jgi:hypothetical protein
LKPSKALLVVVLALSLTFSLVLFPAHPAAAYVPRAGDTFSYYEVENLGNGTGNYAGYTEHTVYNGMETMHGVGADGTVSATYGYSYIFSNSSGSTETGNMTGDYTFSPTTLLYVDGTDDQPGYLNPTVWFLMNDSTPVGGTFSLLDTQMTVVSRNYSYFLPSQDRAVQTIYAQGVSSYPRDDIYGTFNATYTWDVFFDPSTGYIVGYSYFEHDTSSSGDGFTYSDDLYVTAASYPLTAFGSATSGQQSTFNTTSSTVTSPNSSTGGIPLAYIAGAVFLIVLVLAIAVVLSRRRGRAGRGGNLPEHSSMPPPPPDNIDLTPAQQPPVQQIVIKEVAKVKCNYCGALMDSTAQVCPRCGAPRT